MASANLGVIGCAGLRLYALKTLKTRQLVSTPGVCADPVLPLEAVEQYLLTGSC